MPTRRNAVPSRTAWCGGDAIQAATIARGVASSPVPQPIVSPSVPPEYPAARAPRPPADRLAERPARVPGRAGPLAERRALGRHVVEEALPDHRAGVLPRRPPEPPVAGESVQAGPGALLVDEAPHGARVRARGDRAGTRLLVRARERARDGQREQRTHGKAQRSQTPGHAEPPFRCLRG